MTTKEAVPQALPLPQVISRSEMNDRALRWAWREILLALLAAFIVGLGAGAAEALIAWAPG